MFERLRRPGPGAGNDCHWVAALAKTKKGKKMGNNDRQYYSMRTGKNQYSQGIDLPILRRLFLDLYRFFSEKDYFQEAFGYDCVDLGLVAGTLGADVEAQMLRKIRKSNLYPIPEKCSSFTEDDLFDVIEFLYDHISKPIDGTYHSWNQCGWHYHTFDGPTGKSEFRDEINSMLKDYGEGFELSEKGEILIKGEVGLDLLFQADVPSNDDENIILRVHAAINKFRRYRATIEDRRDALRDLADVLEFIRPKLKNVVTKADENDLFNIANGFGIRHHNEKQKTDYEQAIWYSWMFYYYLATIHAVLRLIEKSEKGS